ncbi:TM0106 family RecB-like putative nuclease [Cryobacterium sp. TmT2-59]|uniref:TM0106 family RecB-like putative nuclease n=1 Tax=Cryobacterium sp. TmT2-59 TaxID=1259264 RepID=UPI00106982CF|nr:TM0106 family RecB-like putative nuclease [Cryobacterium sp. TmT2-59]TFC81108.1 TM0106 family RecB-like putative nuclease [Cryobacterium sp. TmT2-59]
MSGTRPAQTVVTSASDLAAASKCEFAFLRKLDAKLGRAAAVPEKADAMLERTARLGDEHEARVLERYRMAGGVVEITRPERMSRASIEIVVADTVRAFAAGADTVFQATFFDETAPGVAFIGFADFIVRRPDGSYLVQDTKLARSARVTALLQLAAYAEQLDRIGVRTAETVQLLLGDGTVSEHRLADIRPVYRKRRERLLRIIGERVAETAPILWGDARYTVCGRCGTCDAEVQARRDVLLVAGLRVSQRARLAEAGIFTIDQLAASVDPVAGAAGLPAVVVDGIGESTLGGLRTQARLQVRAVADEPPPVELCNPAALAVLPAPDAGDIFFDFEGDPLYTEGAAESWGLDYLFGLVEVDGTFRAFWAHTWAEERQALRDFLDYLGARRARYPNLHVYHYAPYERTHLLSIAARHGVGEDEVDALLQQNVLVDLFPLVKKAMRVGSRSYSIKKLEPLYMGADLRVGEVTNAADSITEYAAARDLDLLGQVDEGERMLRSIADYNRYDCVSTLRLRDWLLARAAERGIPVGAVAPEKTVGELEPSPLRGELLAVAGEALDPHRSADRTAAAFAAAALDYHRREQKSFWWGHYARLAQPIEAWEDTRDVLRVERARVERDWYREGRQRTDRRELRLWGRLAPGSSIKPGDQAGPFLLYEYPGPFLDPRLEPGSRTARTVTVLEVADDDSILVRETVPKDTEPWSQKPSALAPAAPPAAGQQKPAIEEWAQNIVDARPGWPEEPMVDILRRVPPRTRSGLLAPVAAAAGVAAGVASGVTAGATAGVTPGVTAGRERIDAVTASLLDLDSSYLAVQGPPGTGKSYLGAHVITTLVRRHGWKIGVVAQSHAVVETLLAAIVKAGLDPALVGKVPRAGSVPSSADSDSDSDADAPARFTELAKDGQLMFALDHAATGFVVGGTAWDFSNPARVPRQSLDLLVVDEAGQFSLASTIAASVGARNLLLLGDPQQLPQVSQGTHPEPIDQSALGWVSAGHDVLPAGLGYFLAESRRMHPAVTEPVSRLSYEGELRSHPDAATRLLEGVAPGLHVVPVTHVGNSVQSPEEAAVVVSLVRSLLVSSVPESSVLVSPGLGRRWTDPTEGRREDPLTEADVIVVTPYNAQLNTVREALAAAGFPRVRVGTVDKFQGQEAAIAIVTLAASSAEDVPRGLSFLIMKNRLNVAISRAKWAAYLVHSPALTEFLPVTPAAVAELSAFITLVESADAVPVPIPPSMP